MSEASFIHDIVRKRSLRRAHQARVAEQIAMASQQTTQEEEFVTVWVGERPDDGKKGTSPAAESAPSTAPVQSATGCSNCSGVATQLFCHELWLLFMLGKAVKGCLQAGTAVLGPSLLASAACTALIGWQKAAEPEHFLSQ